MKVCQCRVLEIASRGHEFGKRTALSMVSGADCRPLRRRDGRDREDGLGGGGFTRRDG